MGKLHFNKERIEQEQSRKRLEYKVQSFTISQRFRKLSIEHQAIVKDLQVGIHLASYFEQDTDVKDEINTVINKYLNKEFVKEEELQYCKALIKEMKSLTDVVEYYRSLQEANLFLGLTKADDFKSKEKKEKPFSCLPKNFYRRRKKEKHYG